jgi:amino acid adenylation domain-containing protein
MSLQNILIHSADRTPNAVAVTGPDGSVTYGELNKLTNRIARALTVLGVNSGDRIGIWLDKSVRTVATMQGVLRLGAVYVPIDPLGPASRTRTILHDCTVKALVTTNKRAEAVLTDELADVACLCIDGIWKGQTWDHLVSLSSDEPIQTPTPADNDLAYILYTSGSTGKPKGVCISHGNALAFINWAAKELQPTPADRFANHAPFHFDLSVLDLYVAFSAGASVSLIPDGMSYAPKNLVNFIIQENITIWYSVPSALVLMIEQGGLLDVQSIPLHTIMFAGEPFAIKHLKRLDQSLPAVRLLNLYGPTETNVCTYYQVQGIENERTKPMPIGRACSGDQVWAIKEDGTVVKPGEEGELMVSGPTVMLGYWGHPPQGNKPYATGDIVQLQEDGNYLYVGRRDHLVKVRGHRVEPGEIEAVLEQHSEIHQAAVVVFGSGMEARLIAFLVSTTVLPLLSVKRHCAERLPRYMIVDEVRFMAALPRTRNGKIDRLALTREAATTNSLLQV